MHTDWITVTGHSTYADCSSISMLNAKLVIVTDANPGIHPFSFGINNLGIGS